MQSALLAPDVYVNASVSVDTPPEQLVRLVLGRPKKPRSTEWILSRVAGMLALVPSFRQDQLDGQLDLIRQHVEVVNVPGTFGPDEWRQALVAGAKAANCSRVVTDHPDFADTAEFEGIAFISTDAMLFEMRLPPPPPSR